MSRLNGYGAYKLYIATKTHFTKLEYDIVKFRGKTRSGPGSFTRRPDKMFFDYVCTKYTSRELLDLFVSNLVTTDLYIGDLLDMEATEVYNKWLYRRDSRTYIFKEELGKLLSTIQNIDNITNINSDSTHPTVVQMVLQFDLSLETFIILDCILDLFSKLDVVLADDFIWNKLSFKCMKYKRLLQINKTEYTDIMNKVISNI